MTYNYRTKGVCSKEMHIELNDDHTIKSVEVIGGCNGNLQGISRLVEGMKAEDAIARMRGIRCGFKNTSCPDHKGFARKTAEQLHGIGKITVIVTLHAVCLFNRLQLDLLESEKHRHCQKNGDKYDNTK